MEDLKVLPALASDLKVVSKVAAKWIGVWAVVIGLFAAWCYIAPIIGNWIIAILVFYLLYMLLSEMIDNVAHFVIVALVRSGIINLFK